MQVTTNGAFGGFEQDQVLTEDTDIIKYFRALLNEGAGEDESSLSDSQILVVIRENFEKNSALDKETFEITCCEELQEMEAFQ
jgi:hypothetical protein